MDGLYTIVELDDGKWFVAAEKNIDDVKYSYLIKVNDKEDDFIDEYKVVKSFYIDDDEYMDLIDDKELLGKIVPILVPESSKFIENPSELKLMLRQIEK